MNEFEHVRQEIMAHESNLHFSADGIEPLFAGSPEARIVVIGQAPGLKAQQSKKVWNDASGGRMLTWLGVSDEEFRNPLLFAHIPMDFYYPGKSASGDKPPRKNFAPLWHARLLAAMPHIEMMLLIGKYAQAHYLPGPQKNVTETVRAYRQYLPDYFPLVHPSPLNFRWFMKNPWFEAEVIPGLRRRTRTILDASLREAGS